MLDNELPDRVAGTLNDIHRPGREASLGDGPAKTQGRQSRSRRVARIVALGRQPRMENAERLFRWCVGAVHLEFVVQHKL